MKKAEYMMDHIGEEFEGVVNSALKFGIFVSLPNTVEGLVHTSNMKDDYYIYDETHMALIGRDHHHIFSIGQAVKVKVIGASKEEHKVDFQIVDVDSVPTTDIKVQAPEQKTFDHKRPRSRNKNAKNEPRGKKRG
jgi:ribonuclease R